MGLWSCDLRQVGRNLFIDRDAMVFEGYHGGANLRSEGWLYHGELPIPDLC